MTNINFFKKLTIVLVIVFFASCDKDYNTIGSEVSGNENFNFTSKFFEVRAYNQKIDAVQTNNLAINQLGIIKNAAFGVTKANFVTQLSLSPESIGRVFPIPGTIPGAIYEGVVIDSVILDIPYVSTITKTESSGRNEYKLNSIYTTKDPTSDSFEPTNRDEPFDPIDLKVFRNGFELNDYDPNVNFQSLQKFYSDQDSDFNSFKVGSNLNDKVGFIDPANPSLGNENTIFVPNKKEFVKYKVNTIKSTTNPYTTTYTTSTTEVESRSAPSMRMHLRTSDFYTDIINAGTDKLVNNNVFKVHYKGLYFQVQNASRGSLMKLDFRKGTVKIYYREDKFVLNGTTILGNDRPMKTIILNISGNTVNLFDVSSNIVNSSVTTPDRVNGDSKLYLKGGQGSLAYIELFKDVAVLEDFKAKKVLVNDASLTFTVDSALPVDFINPLRVYLFDADNDKYLLDYIYDTSTNSSDPLLNKFIYGGILTNNSGVKTYKIRITEHVNKILREALGSRKENVRLGLVITDNIANASHGFLKNTVTVPSLTDPIKQIKTVPAGSILSPLGAVLYGTNSAIPSSQRIKFEIYYTEPK